MKNQRRILAIIGIILLVAMYVMTLIAALFGGDNTMPYLAASIGSTLIIPVTVWVVGVFFRISKRNENDPILFDQIGGHDDAANKNVNEDIVNENIHEEADEKNKKVKK